MYVSYTNLFKNTIYIKNWIQFEKIILKINLGPLIISFYSIAKTLNGDASFIYIIY